jgi:hypothetical protein
MRECFIRAKCEFYTLIVLCLSQTLPNWKADPLLVSGLVLADLIGIVRISTAKDQDKRDIDALLADIVPIAKKVFADGVKFAASHEQFSRPTPRESIN